MLWAHQNPLTLPSPSSRAQRTLHLLVHLEMGRATWLVLDQQVEYLCHKSVWADKVNSSFPILYAPLFLCCSHYRDFEIIRTHWITESPQGGQLLWCGACTCGRFCVKKKWVLVLLNHWGRGLLVTAADSTLYCVIHYLIVLLRSRLCLLVMVSLLLSQNLLYFHNIFRCPLSHWVAGG